MLPFLQTALLMLTTTAAAPAGCPGSATEADALLKRAADAANLTEMQRMIGHYTPVAIERLGVVSEKVYRQQSGLPTKHLWQVNFHLDGAVADYQTPFLAAHPARTRFKVDCSEARCSWRPADGNDLNDDRIDRLTPPGGLYMANVYPSKDAPGQVVLGCSYRGP
ncbi:hypothetical protein [Sphingopyxis sp. RIFCSPHIGHO2_12_FULL_65_19]|uniref:hypothetical protein n=1 Tax=Sphingopyxis sp. RIFCSPHIGHO2_12_FULL_65_19 TaxID=1802172 RepID=UPI0008CC1660|nr:hypothetical protein [Sphingopyxis sp. RIFCSPHIGHO2_12_FULL_65_19]OHD09524.1 MAG: hypothetical protein A3E77_17025 [Sphingopyxis sp. RIFCSPHIGHO2_12_FULL_65_19]